MRGDRGMIIPLHFGIGWVGQWSCAAISLSLSLSLLLGGEHGRESAAEKRDDGCGLDGPRRWCASRQVGLFHRGQRHLAFGPEQPLQLARADAREACEMQGGGFRRVERRRFRAVFVVALARDLFVVAGAFVARGARRASALVAAYCATLRLFAALPLSLSLIRSLGFSLSPTFSLQLPYYISL